jgi:hypothetical protein
MKKPFAPQVPVAFSISRRGITANDMGIAYLEPSAGREHDEGSQYYGHDLVIKTRRSALGQQAASANNRARITICAGCKL